MADLESLQGGGGTTNLGFSHKVAFIIPEQRINP